MSRVYATEAEYVEWTGQAAPAGIGRRLARASEVVADATMTAVYATDSAGMPTDLVVSEAMRDATCAQARWWLATGDELGDASRWTSAGIGSVSLSGGRGAGGDSAAERLAPQARTALRLAGLLGQEPIT